MFEPLPEPQQDSKPPKWEQAGGDTTDPIDHMVPFRATVTAVELDIERRPVKEFSARTTAISCSGIELHTRRMIYTGSPILIILPLLDSTPCVVGCLVTSCSYDTAGDYLIKLEFSNYARSRYVDNWMGEHGYSVFKPATEVTDPPCPDGKDKDDGECEDNLAA